MDSAHKDITGENRTWSCGNDHMVVCVPDIPIGRIRDNFVRNECGTDNTQLKAGF